MEKKKWRLLDYGVPNSKMNLAIEEAVLKSRSEGKSPDTLRLWQNPTSILLSDCHYDAQAEFEACRKHGVEIARRLSLRKVLYNDSGSLNFSVITKVEKFKSSQDMINTFTRLYRGVAEGIHGFGIEVEVDPYGEHLVVDNKKISDAAPYFFHEILLFSGTIFVNTDLMVARDVLKAGGMLTSLNLELNRSVDVNEVKESLKRAFEKELDIEFEVQGLTEYEQKVANILYEWKYNTDEWTIKGKASPAPGKTLVEVFVAHPPTFMCNELIKLVKDVTSDLQEKVEIKIWRRGLGIPPGETITLGLKKAAKESQIPAIIINGKLKFGREIPRREELRATILHELETPMPPIPLGTVWYGM
jgi:lipoate-protein ligase A